MRLELNFTKMHIISGMFADLLTDGRGHPGSPRNKNVSFEKIYPIVGEDIYQKLLPTPTFRITWVSYHIKTRGLE